MSKIRTIKPEFWTSEQIVLCSRDARLIFIGMWNFCDDAGVSPVSYITLKAQVFPLDHFSVDQIKALVNELIKNGLIEEFEYEGSLYWKITGWEKHQKIERPRYKYPNPSEKKVINSAAQIAAAAEQIAAQAGKIDVAAAKITVGMEGNGMDMEWKGMERKGEESRGEGDFFVEQARPIESLSDVLQVFNFWKTTMHHPNAVLDKKRKRYIRDALKMGYSVAQLCDAITGCSLTPHNQGDNDRNQRYDGLHIILREADQIDRFIKNCHSPPRKLLSGQKDLLEAGLVGMNWMAKQKAKANG